MSTSGASTWWFLPRLFLGVIVYGIFSHAEIFGARGKSGEEEAPISATNHVMRPCRANLQTRVASSPAIGRLEDHVVATDTDPQKGIYFGLLASERRASRRSSAHERRPSLAAVHNLSEPDRVTPSWGRYPKGADMLLHARSVVGAVASKGRFARLTRKLFLHMLPTMPEGKLSPIFWIVVFRRGRSNRGIGAPTCGGAKEMFMSCSMCGDCTQSLWR